MLLNAGDEPIAFTLPEPTRVRWRLTLDTAEHGVRLPGERTYDVAGRSLAVFSGQPV
jgi:hypothetical protein